MDVKFDTTPATLTKMDTEIRSEKSLHRCCCCNVSGRAYNIIEKVVLTVICVMILLMFTSIYLVYYITEYAVYHNTMNSTINRTLTIPTCNGSNTTEPITLCSLYGTAVSTGCSSNSCPTNTYTGSVCRQSLSTWQTCALDGNHNTLHTSTTDQATLEANLVQVANLLDLANQECQYVALPFLCLYAFPLCDCSSQKMYTPTRETCEQVRDSICLMEWTLVTRQFGPHFLPDCSTLPSATIDSSGSDTVAPNSTCPTNNTNNTNNTQTVTCRYDFIKQNGTCRPRCDQWKQDPDNISKALDIIEIIFVSIGICIAFVCLGFTIYEYKTLLRFPVCFVTFIILDYIIIAFFTIISAIEKNELYCSDVRLDISHESPSIYCTLSGVAIHYVSIQVFIFWLSHVSFIYYGVVFPLHAKKTKGTLQWRFIEITTIVVGFIAPAIAVIVIISTPNLEYVQNSVPTLFCTVNYYHVWFYTYIAPITAMMSIGTCLLVVIIWNVHKHQGIFKKKEVVEKNYRRFNGAEKKLLLVLLSVLVFGILISIYFTIFGATRKDFIMAVQKYFTCEASGHVPGKCSRDEVEKYSTPFLAMFSYISPVLIPLFSLNFVINWQKITNIHTWFKSDGSLRSNSPSISNEENQQESKMDGYIMSALSSNRMEEDVIY